jgi:RNA polymerase primary sigma factor
LILGNLRLVISIAKGFRRYHTPFSDLIQEGNLALMKAVEKFDFQRGVRFTSYATWWIWKAIGRMVRERNRVIHVPNQLVVTSRRLDRQGQILKQRLGRPPTMEELSDHCGVSPEQIDFLRELPVNEFSLSDWGSDSPDYLHTQAMLSLPAVHSPFKETFLAEQKMIISEVLRKLPALEADILRKRYGLEGYEEHTLSEISEMYQLSRERIRQLETRGLRRLAQDRVFWEMAN